MVGFVDDERPSHRYVFGMHGELMNAPALSRRAVVLGAAAIALGASRVSAQSTPLASPTGAAFPVTFQHAFGSTTIENKPERVIALGWSSYDAVIALGTIPVGIPADFWGGDAEGFLPWTREALGDNELPTMLDFTAGVPFEAIIELQPDAIIAPYSGFTSEEYETLSRIAPTIPHTTTAWSGSWQEVTLIAGRALGNEAAAEQLIADTNEYVAEQAAAYPELAGKTFIYGNMGDGTTSFNIYTVTDSRPLFLESIGLVPSDVVKNLPITEASPYYTTVSYERANELVADITVFWFTDEAEYATAQEASFFKALPAVANGTMAAIVGRDYVMATSAFSTLSIAYALGEFLPTLAAAAANS
jgi:iron complex transport system substrate-binding protein